MTVTAVNLLTPHSALLSEAYPGYLTAANYWLLSDVGFMRRALALAQQGASQEEVPVGAVLVCDNKIIGEGFNQPITTSDPTAHAEVVALRCACQTLQNYRLPPNTTLYVTLEPCTMCLGALIHARLARLVFATFEPRAGMVGSQLNLTKMDFYNHKMQAYSGLLQQQSQTQLRSFFRARRGKKKPQKQSD
jgi:tRNA(Arg) A34 adenosine deaminase TadA